MLSGLLHPRNGEKDNMQKFATRLLNDWLDRRPSDSTKGVIAVSYDQRNHGTRNVHQLANESWRDGNEVNSMGSIFAALLTFSRLMPKICSGALCRLYL